MIDVEKIRRCNEQWIFFNDDIRIRSTFALLNEIIYVSESNMSCYSKSYEELDKYYKYVYDKVSSEEVPTLDEISNTRDLLLIVTLKLKRERLLKSLSECIGISMSRDFLYDKYRHNKSLNEQAKIALKRFGGV